MNFSINFLLKQSQNFILTLQKKIIKGKSRLQEEETHFSWERENGQDHECEKNGKTFLSCGKKILT